MTEPYTRRLLTIELRGFEIDWREAEAVLILNDKIAVRLSDANREALAKLLARPA